MAAGSEQSNSSTAVVPDIRKMRNVMGYKLMSWVLCSFYEKGESFATPILDYLLQNMNDRTGKEGGEGLRSALKKRKRVVSMGDCSLGSERMQSDGTTVPLVAASSSMPT